MFFAGFVIGGLAGAAGLFVYQQVSDPKKRLAWREAQLESHRQRMATSREQDTKVLEFLEKAVAELRGQVQQPSAP